jgi:multidrug efflux system membrane fusion protein
MPDAVKRGALVLSAALVIVILASGCSKQKAVAASGAPAAPVKVALAETKTLPIELRAFGNVEAFKTISVKSQQTGALMRVNFKEGDPVTKGQLLFEIDPRTYQEAIHQIEANLARDNALLKQAEANLARDIAQEKFSRDQARRYSELAKQGVFSKEQSDQANSTADSQGAALSADRAAIDSSRSAIVADDAALANAKLQLSYCYIYSAVDGRTGNISVKEGNLVKATDIELVTITQIQPVYVTFTVPERQLPVIRDRMRAGKLVVRAVPQGSGTTAEEGALTFVDNAVDQATGTIKLKATFVNGASRLWPGQFCDVVVTLGRKPDVVAIPNQAVQTGQAGRYVFVVKDDRTVEMRPVVIGESVGGWVEVQQGVQAGETVVTEGHIRLASGSKVRAQS